jgi:hypothetical protein
MKFLRTYLVYRHHVKLPYGTPVTPPGARLPTLMGAVPVPA